VDIKHKLRILDYVYPEPEVKAESTEYSYNKQIIRKWKQLFLVIKYVIPD